MTSRSPEQIADVLDAEAHLDLPLAEVRFPPRRRASDAHIPGAMAKAGVCDRYHRLSVDQLWTTFWTTRDAGARDELIVRHLYLVDMAVRRLPSTVLAYWRSDDLRSFGVIGLIDAVDRRRSDLSQVPFAAYALCRVRGAIFDELRHLDWLPRTLRHRVGEYRETEEELQASADHAPTRAEVLAAMERTGHRGNAAATVLAVQRGQLLSLQEPLHGHDNLRSDNIASLDDPAEEVMAGCDRAELRLAIAKLPERERSVISYRFLAGLTQKQAAVLCGVSSARICQLQSKALEELRRLLTKRGYGVGRAAGHGRSDP